MRYTYQYALSLIGVSRHIHEYVRTRYLGPPGESLMNLIFVSLKSPKHTKKKHIILRPVYGDAPLTINAI